MDLSSYMNLQQAVERVHPIPLVSVQWLDLSSILLPCCVDQAYHVVADIRGSILLPHVVGVTLSGVRTANRGHGGSGGSSAGRGQTAWRLAGL